MHLMNLNAYSLFLLSLSHTTPITSTTIFSVFYFRKTCPLRSSLIHKSTQILKLRMLVRSPKVTSRSSPLATIKFWKILKKRVSLKCFKKRKESLRKLNKICIKLLKLWRGFEKKTLEYCRTLITRNQKKRIWHLRRNPFFFCRIFIIKKLFKFHVSPVI